MKRLLGLVMITVLPSLAAPPAALPAVGRVDLDRLVELLARAETTAWAERAGSLRERAAAAPQVTVPPAPRPEQAGPGGLGGQANGFEEKAAQLELALLQEALQEQNERRLQAELTIRSGRLAKALGEHRETTAEQQREWERSLAMSQRFERINLRIELLQAGLPALEMERLKLELNTLDAATQAIDRDRERERQRALTRFTRQQVEGLQRGLREQAGEAGRQGERYLARREADLADEQALNEEFRADRLKRLARLEVDLDLDVWREALPARANVAAERTEGQKRALREAAQSLDATAEDLSDAGRDALRASVLAMLKTIERRQGVKLSLDPASEGPDVTDQVAAWIVALRADLAALAPPRDVPWP